MAEDIGIELHDKIKRAFDVRCEKDSTLTHIKRKIENGTATMEDTSVYARRLGENLRKSIESTTKPDDLPGEKMYYNIAQSILEPLLRNNYDDVNGICAEVQRALDAKKGIGIAPQKADFPAERIRAAIGGAAVKETAEHAIQVLGRTAENITGSFQTDYIKKNAEFRSKAGLDCYIERKDGHNCCDWCSKLAGRYRYPDEVPKDVYRRHDNCTCDVSYVSEKGRQNVHSKRWANEQAKAQRIEYAASLPKPMKLTRAEAQTFEREMSKIKTDNPETIVVKKDILSPEYRRHFNEFEENANVTSVMCREAREMLSRRTGTLFEDMAYIDSVTGKCKIQKNYNVKQQVIPTKAMKTMVNNNPPYTIISIHNHPQSTVPSIDDLDSCYKHKYKYGVIACHDGNAFRYSVKGDFDKNYTDMLLDNVQMILYNKNKIKPEEYKEKLKNALKELSEQNIELEVFTWV